MIQLLKYQRWIQAKNSQNQSQWAINSCQVSVDWVNQIELLLLEIYMMSKWNLYDVWNEFSVKEISNGFWICDKLIRPFSGDFIIYLVG